MELNKIRQRLELAVNVEKPPTIEKALEQVSTRGVLWGACGLGLPGVDHLCRIRDAEDYRDVSAYRGRKESAP